MVSRSSPRTSMTRDPMSNEQHPASDEDDRLDEAYADYLEAVEDGRFEESPTSLARHPEVAKVLAAHDRLDREAAALRTAMAPIHSLLSEEPSVAPGTLIGDYEVIREIGRGAAGVVYEARHIRFDQTVALKMRLSGRRASREDVRRFEEEVANQVALYDLLAIPVVDDTNKLVGTITVDDVIDVIKDEATEDIFYLAGVEADDHIHTPALTSVKKRLPWLMVNLATALLAATVVALYEPTIAQFSFLAVFLPVVAGLGGNSGTQTLTVMVRGLALGEVSWESGKGILLKEIKVGINNGIAIGIIAGTVAYLWKGNYMLGLVLGGAMTINIVVAGVVGTLVPLILKKLNVDPAIASSIFVTTFTDAVGFLSFLGLATVLLHHFPV